MNEFADGTAAGTETISEVVALIDWDNVVALEVRTDLDADNAVHAVKGLVVPVIRAQFPAARNAEVRLYHALEFERQRPTRWAPFVRAAASRATERFGGLVVTFSCAEQLEVDSRLSAPSGIAPFLQREQCRCERHTPINVQKLVDTMIVADTAFYGPFSNFGVIVVSDDVDMTPGLVLSADQRALVGGSPATSLVWMRPHGALSPYGEQFRALFNVVGATA